MDWNKLTDIDVCVISEVISAQIADNQHSIPTHKDRPCLTQHLFVIDRYPGTDRRPTIIPRNYDHIPKPLPPDHVVGMVRPTSDHAALEGLGKPPKSGSGFLVLKV